MKPNVLQNAIQPAFPEPIAQHPNGYPISSTSTGFYTGFTKREMLAAMAMQGLLASCHVYAASQPFPEAIALDAVKQADELLIALDVAPVVEKKEKVCTHDTDGEGDCPLHPDGCPKS